MNDAGGAPCVPAPLAPDAARARIAHAAPGTLDLLDVREDAAFAAGHLAASGHVPRAEFRARRAELPPRDTELLVVAASAGAAEAAACDLAALGFTRVHFLSAALATMTDGLADRSPARALWRPSPFLVESLPMLIAALHDAGLAPAGDGVPPPGARPAPHAADLACGAGREAATLARHGFAVEAWDHDPDALARARGLAARAGVAIETVRCDLEQPDAPLPGGRYALVTCFRFLHRPLFPAIARALAPGGVLVYETYRTGQERHGRPRRARFLLEDGELARAFPDLETLRHEESDPPGGPVTARLIARRPRR